MTYLTDSLQLICNDRCQYLNWETVKLFLKASWKSFRVSVLGIGHPDIRGFGDRSLYRQVNGPPWALPSNCVDHRFLCANIDLSQIARTLKWPKPFQDVFSCYFSYWPDVCGASHLTSAWLPAITAGWWCQGCEAPLAAAWSWYRQHDVIPVSGDMISHHAPHETCEFPCNCRFSDIVFLAFIKHHLVVSTSKTFVSFVSINDDCRRIPWLTGFQLLFQ
mgnify:CR=1 FL=1